MAAKTLDVVQEILKHLDEIMDEETPSLDAISAENLGITKQRRNRIIGMMIEEGLIDGFTEVPISGRMYSGYKAISPRITLAGLQYLYDNSAQAKIYRAAKELRDWLPG